jgi:predicted ribosome quality control (RQC) complex YloA/Tae2 family protein
MSLNCREIDEVLSELPLSGSFLQNIRQADFHHLLFDFFGKEGPFTLLVSLKAAALRLHATSERYPSLKTPPRFLQLLRARVKGGKVLDALQLGKERIVRLEISRNDGLYRLYIRLWGGAANLILTDDKGLVADAFSRRPSRGEIPGGSYSPETADNKPGKDFALRDLPGEGTYNRRLDLFYRETEDQAERLRLTEKVRIALESRERKLKSLIDNLERKQEDSAGAADFRKWGDLVMSHLHLLKRGDTWLEAEDFETPGQMVRIPLDPELSPHENAEKLYKKRSRLETGSQLAEEELTLSRRELIRLYKAREHLLGGSATLEELAAALPEQKEQAAGEEHFPGLRFTSGPFRIYVGRTATENDGLLRSHVNGNDLWLHTRDYPGGYVFIKVIRGKSIPLEVLLDAGNLAVWYSKARPAGEAELYYTPVKYLRRAKNGPKGLVLPTREKNLHVRIETERLKRLQGG